MSSLPSPASLSETALLQQAMLFFQLEQRHQLVAHGAHTHTRMLVVLKRKGALLQSELVRIMALEKSWVSRAVDKLVEHGWVIREPAGGDRRNIRLQLTPAGLVEAAELERLLDQHALSVLARLDEEGRTQVVHAMRLLHAVLEPSGRSPRAETAEDRA